jgi:hypothetical protein
MNLLLRKQEPSARSCTTSQYIERWLMSAERLTNGYEVKLVHHGLPA